MMKNAERVCQENASQFTTCQKRILIGDFDDKAKKMKIAMCNKLPENKIHQLLHC